MANRLSTISVQGFPGAVIPGMTMAGNPLTLLGAEFPTGLISYGDINLIGTPPPTIFINGEPFSGGAAQTPWESDIDGNGFALFNAAFTDVIDGYYIQGQQLARSGPGGIELLNISSSTISGFQTPWLSDIDGAGFNLNNVNSVNLFSTFFPTLSFLNSFNGSMGITVRSADQKAQFNSTIAGTGFTFIFGDDPNNTPLTIDRPTSSITIGAPTLNFPVTMNTDPFTLYSTARGFAYFAASTIDPNNGSGIAAGAPLLATGQYPAYGQGETNFAAVVVATDMDAWVLGTAGSNSPNLVTNVVPIVPGSMWFQAISTTLMPFVIQPPAGQPFPEFSTSPQSYWASIGSIRAAANCSCDLIVYGQVFIQVMEDSPTGDPDAPRLWVDGTGVVHWG